MEEELRQKIIERTDGWTDNMNESSLDYDFMSRHPTLSISFLVFTCVSVVFGNIGNIMVIGAVVTYKPLMRNKGSMFVINLAIADLCITGIVSPMNMVGVTHGPRYFVDRVLLCNILGSVCTVSCIVSMLSIAAVAVNRAIMVCCHFKYDEIFTMRKTICYCTALWCISICADLPTWFGVGGHTFALKEMGCTFDRSANHNYTVFMASMSMLTPMVVVGTSYLFIYRYIRVAHEEYKKYLGQMSRQRRRWEQKFAMTLFVSFVVFVLCWSLYMTAAIFDRNDTWPKQVYVIGTIIGHANSFLNPIIYATMNAQLRTGYIVFLKRLTCQFVPKEPYLKERRHSTFKSSISYSSGSSKETRKSSLRSTISSANSVNLCNTIKEEIGEKKEIEEPAFVPISEIEEPAFVPISEIEEPAFVPISEHM